MRMPSSVRPADGRSGRTESARRSLPRAGRSRAASRRCPARRHTSWQGSLAVAGFILVSPALPLPAAARELGRRREAQVGGSSVGAAAGRLRRRSGAEIALATRQRRLLAALIVGGGEVCSRDSLVEAVWNGAPPQFIPRRCCRCTCRGCGTRCATGMGFVRTSPAMQWRSIRSAFDAARFERLLGEARASAREGNAALAVSLLDRASLLWRRRRLRRTLRSFERVPPGLRRNGWRSCVCWPSKSSSRQRSS